MSVPAQEVATDPAEAPGSELVVSLDTIIPSTMPVGSTAAVFCVGSCFHRREAIKDLELAVDGVHHRAVVFGMPRPDVLQALRTRASGGRALAPWEQSLPASLELRSYRSGFWATVPVRAPAHPGQVRLQVAARLANDVELVCDLGRLDVAEPEPPLHSGVIERGAGDGLIAICMATFEPDMRLFRIQIDSLRAQTDRRWVCLISDDCSSPERFREIQQAVDGDRRFVISRSPKHLGFYHNFERALTMVPACAELVALSDQDDRWHPEKLEVLRNALGGAQLVYSDLRLVDADGRLLRDTLWKGRRNNYVNLGSELVANTIAGAAMLLRRELLQLALPFPEAPGALFHDHWIGLVAMASGKVAYVNRPLYDYVQHGGAVFGDVSRRQNSAPRGWTRIRPQRRWWRGRLERWRAAYFYGYVPRQVLAETLLARGDTAISRQKRRALRRFVASSSSPVAFAWLALRPLRVAVGLNETLGSEFDLVRGIAWKWLIALRARRARLPDRVGYDARPPDPAKFEQRRLRRWRARV